MYRSNGVVNSAQPFHHRSLPSQQSQYSNGHPSKRRRATITTKRPSQSHPPPLPTPTSTTHPPVIREHRPSDAGRSETNSRPSPSDTTAANPSDSAVMSPFTPSPNQAGRNLPSNNGTGLALPFSPNFSFSPLPQFASLAPSPISRAANQVQDHSSMHFDPMLSMPTPIDQQPTPGAGSTSGASVHTDPDSKDPFLSLLEQLAENEVSRGGPSELDFFLSGPSG
jgi:hypothetical protein